MTFLPGLAIAVPDVAALPDGALLALVEEVERLGRQIDAARAIAAAEVAERSRFELGSDGLARSMGHSRPGHLLEQLTRSSARDVAARMQVGRMVRGRATIDGSPLPPLYPLVADSLSDGSIGMESARAITRTLEEAAPDCSPDDLALAERALVEQALERSADLVAAQARLWREVLSPDDIEPREESARRKRAFRFGREVDGLANISITASGVDLAELRATFAAYGSPRIEPRFRDACDVDASDPFRETRSADQRNFDVFMGLIRAGAGADTHRPGPRAAVTLIALASDLSADSRNASGSGGRGSSSTSGSGGSGSFSTSAAGRGSSSTSGAGWLDDVDAPVATPTIRELTCSAIVRTAVASPTGEILALGRAERYFTAAQSAALALRDGGCIWPHCTAPPAWCDSHHIEHWSSGGATDVSNGALLCPAHHRLLHASDFELSMRRGTPHLRAPARLDPERRWRRAGQSRTLELLAQRARVGNQRFSERDPAPD